MQIKPTFHTHLISEVPTVLIPLLLITSAMAQNAEVQVLQGNVQFTSDLYSHINQGSENLIFSPISVHAVLSMALQGAQGTSAQSLIAALKVPSLETAAEGYSHVINRLNNVENVTLALANKVYLMQGYHLQAPFETSLTKNFQSNVQQLDFGQSAVAAKSINQWVEEQTNSKIKDLISSDSVDGSTRLVLVNAIYFKGNWGQQFDKALTTIQPFYPNDKESVDVNMMHLKKKFPYKRWEELKAQVLELPYSNKDLSMFIVLPDEKNGIAELESKLIQGGRLEEISKDLHKVEVNVSLPRFKIESTINLEDTLKKLGLEVIFDQTKANFQGMIQEKEQLYVSKVIQKAFIEVNEEGSEAAAATGIMVATYSFVMPAPVPQFIADRPFLYMLACKKNPLFIGHVIKPEK